MSCMCCKDDMCIPVLGDLVNENNQNAWKHNLKVGLDQQQRNNTSKIIQ